MPSRAESGALSTDRFLFLYFSIEENIAFTTSTCRSQNKSAQLDCSTASGTQTTHTERADLWKPKFPFNCYFTVSFSVVLKE